MADHQGKAGDVRRDGCRKRAPSRHRDGLCQSAARGRLDRDGPARDDRRRDPVRPSRGRSDRGIAAKKGAARMEDMDGVTESARHGGPGPRRKSKRRSPGQRKRCWPRSARMGISSSNSKPMFRSRRNIFFFSIFSASLPTPRLKPRSRPISGANRRRMTAGRCSLMAPSTSAAASRPILR